MIAKNPTSEFNLKQQSKLEKLRRLSKRFDTAYKLRNRFYELFDISDIEGFVKEGDKLLNDLKNSKIKECMEFGRRR